MLSMAQAASRRMYIDVSKDMIDASQVAFLESVRSVISEGLRDGTLDPIEVRKTVYLIDRNVDIYEREGN